MDSLLSWAIVVKRGPVLRRRTRRSKTKKRLESNTTPPRAKNEKQARNETKQWWWWRGWEFSQFADQQNSHRQVKSSQAKGWMDGKEKCVCG